MNFLIFGEFLSCVARSCASLACRKRYNVVYGVLHGYWVLLELVDRLPNVDGTPKYCQNALEVAVGSCIRVVHDPTATSEAFWQYFGVPSTLGRRSTSSCKTQGSCKTPGATLVIFCSLA